jgi:hypothetical protein
MAVPTNTLVKASVVGEREDLENDIYRVAPEETPFTSNIGKTKVKNTLHEWQVEALATPDANNANYEGDDANIDAAHQPVRRSVFAQIFDKAGSVSGTVAAADNAGREDEEDYQKMIKGIELRRDIEARMIGNLASVNETAGSVTRKTAGALAWIETADSSGGGGSSGGWASAGVVAAATNGTQRAFSEALLKAIQVTGFNAGARYSQIYLSGSHKQGFSAFAGIADIRKSAEGNKQATIIGAADVYVGDFGEVTAIPHPYGLTRDALLIDPSGWAVGTYRGMSTTKLAKTGDSEKFQIVCEKALICRNEKKGAAIRDLT